MLWILMKLFHKHKITYPILQFGEAASESNWTGMLWYWNKIINGDYSTLEICSPCVTNMRGLTSFQGLLYHYVYILWYSSPCFIHILGAILTAHPLYILMIAGFSMTSFNVTSLVPQLHWYLEVNIIISCATLWNS